MEVPKKVIQLLILQFLFGCAGSSFIPFYPLYCKRIGLDPKWTGYIFGTFTTMQAIANLISGKYLLKCITKKQGMYIGSVAITLGQLSLGCLGFLKDP